MKLSARAPHKIRMEPLSRPINALVLFFLTLVGQISFAQQSAFSPPIVRRAINLVTLPNNATLTDWFFGQSQIQIDQFNGQFVISGKDTQAKKEVASSLLIWLGFDIKNQSTIDWSADIDLTMPVQSVLKSMAPGNAFPVNGINCHNTSLVTSGFLKFPSYTGFEEMEFYINNFCQRIEKPEPGAIGYLNRKGLNSHSFKYIGQNLIFEKKSNWKGDPYRFRLTTKFDGVEFFSCKKIPTEFCPGRFNVLKSRVADIDQIYSMIVLRGQQVDRRNSALEMLNPLLAEIESEINFVNKNEIESQTTNPNLQSCKIDLERLRFRTLSLLSLGNQISGTGLFEDKTGFIKIEPKE